MEYLLVKRISSQVLTSSNAAPSKHVEADASKVKSIETSEASTQVLGGETEHSVEDSSQLLNSSNTAISKPETSEASTQVIEHGTEHKSVEDSMSETELFIYGTEMACNTVSEICLTMQYYLQIILSFLIFPAFQVWNKYKFLLWTKLRGCVIFGFMVYSW